MLPELEAIQNILKYNHHQIKQVLAGLDEEGLNWTPAGVDKVNSVYGLVLHCASAQVMFLALAAGQDVKLDIPELVEGDHPLKAVCVSADRAIELLRQSAQMSNELFEKFTPEILDHEVNMLGGGMRPARFLLPIMVAHGAEHIGHMALTKQLYEHGKAEFGGQRSEVS
jgi:DinB superfamily